MKSIELNSQKIQKKLLSHCEHHAHAVFHQFRPMFEYHLSVIYLNRKVDISDADKQNQEDINNADENFLRELLFRFAGPLIIELRELDLRSFYRGTENRIYLTRWQGWTVPLYRKLANELHYQICCMLQKYFDDYNVGIRVSF